MSKPRRGPLRPARSGPADAEGAIARVADGSRPAFLANAQGSGSGAIAAAAGHPGTAIGDATLDSRHRPGEARVSAEPTPRFRGERSTTRLAVLIPVYNDQVFLERALAWLGREDAPFDVVIVDDGSEPPVRIPPALPFAVELVRLPQNAGIVAALNAGLRTILAAGYDYVARMDADDISLPGRFRAQMAFLDTHPDHAVVGSWYEEVDAGLATLFVHRPATNHEQIVRELRYRNPFAHSAVMMRVATLHHHAWYDERYRGTEDYEFFFRLAQHEKVANLATIFLRCQVTGKTSSSRRAFRHVHRLRVQLHNFEAHSAHCYLGLLRTCLMMLVPRRATIALKRLWT